MTRERKLLEQLVKAWAQEHTDDFSIADYTQSEEAMTNTEGYLTWVVREGHANLDLISLVDRLEIFLDNKRKRKYPDGMICVRCKSFYDFAEPNQSDGTLICYTCRSNPFK